MQSKTIFKFFNFRSSRLNFSKKIFLALLLVLVLTAFSMVLATFYHFNKTTGDYHKVRLEHKKTRIIKELDYIMSSRMVNTENIDQILSQDLFKIAEVDNILISLYNIDGNFIFSSQPPLFHHSEEERSLEPHLVDSIKIHHNLFSQEVNSEDGVDTYLLKDVSFIFDTNQSPLAIIEFSYEEDGNFLEEGLDDLYKTIGSFLLSILIIVSIISYYISNNITKNIRQISHIIKSTRLSKNIKPIQYYGTDEIRVIIRAYNRMIVELDKSSKELAQKEREYAWKEMAKQVAHEIKNPLTPIKLTIQSFQRKYTKPDKSPSVEQIDKMCNSLVAQVDTISNIANTFADFAKMPENILEKVDLTIFLKEICYLFNNQNVNLIIEDDNLMVTVDKAQINRVIMNLIKNGLQSVPIEKIAKVDVFMEKLNDNVIISVTDNGTGIPLEIQDKVFEPKFTTKNSGMGLGLAIVRKIIEDHNGSIDFKTSKDNGTSFFIHLPLTNESI